MEHAALTQRIALLDTAVQVTGLVVIQQATAVRKLKTSNSIKCQLQCACQPSQKGTGFPSSTPQPMYSNTIIAD